MRNHYLVYQPRIPASVSALVKDILRNPSPAAPTLSAPVVRRHVVFIVDASASAIPRQAAWWAAVRREVYALQQASPGTKVTVVAFAEHTRILHMARPAMLVQGAKPGAARGGSAIRDAIGHTIECLLERDETYHQGCLITVHLYSDGRDTASFRYSEEVLSKLISKLKATRRWTFITHECRAVG